MQPHEPYAQQGEPPDFDYFVCTCNAEGLREANELMAEVRTRLTAATTYMEAPLSDATFLTAVVSSLHCDFRASITKILHEQWSAVLAQSDDGSYRTAVQCDFVEHGIAATWKAFADRAEVPVT